MRVWVALFAASGCVSADFDGVYRVDSYQTFEPCDGEGVDVPDAFTRFEIRDRGFAGVTIYPVYPCGESGACAVDNDANWSLVVVEEDLDAVSMTFTTNEDDACILASEDKVIDRAGADQVVLQSRQMRLEVRPYKASTCTTDEAEARRDEMSCGALIELIGTRESTE